MSQPSYPPSGHCFFTLKDAASQVKAVLFREELARATVRPEHGMQVICHGKVRAYEPQGTYQVYVESITPAGAGDLHQQYEALRAKLAAEGLFEEGRKRPLPRWPKRIGVVTSPVGAVWRDIGNVMRRRYPIGELVLSPTIVQGPTAAGAIVRALNRLYADDGGRPGDPGPRRRLARGPLVVQRRARGAGRGRLAGAGGRRGGP